MNFRKWTKSGSVDKSNHKRHGSGSSLRNDATSSTGNEAPTVHMFMLGHGNVGKTAVIRQMQKLCVLSGRGERRCSYTMYNDDWTQVVTPFDEHSRMAHTLTVRQHVLRIAAILIEQSSRFGHGYASPLHATWASQLRQVAGDSETVHQCDVTFDGESAERMATLWEELGGAWRKTAARGNEFAMPTSAPYFLRKENLMRFASVDYVPTMDDIIHARTPTHGAPRTYNFLIDGRRFAIRDVGGQQSELRKVAANYLSDWLKTVRQQGKGTYCILFVAALSDYNQPHGADKDSTLLRKSLYMLQHLLQNVELTDVQFVIFLNKDDVFEERMRQLRDIDKYYGATERRNGDAEASPANDGRRRIMAYLGEIFARSRPDRPFVRCTCATDTEAMETLLAAARTYTLELAWNSIGMPTV